MTPTKEQIEREVNHIFESGANEIRVIELIERLLQQQPKAQGRLTPEEFLISKIQPDYIWEEMGNLTNCPIRLISEIMQAYHEHCEASAWVDVNVRLPDRNTNVLLKRGEPFHIYLKTGFQRDGHFYSNESAVNITNVTHWRPLPQPPKQ